jgi:tetratricopeptide (TPR) repeat protein
MTRSIRSSRIAAGAALIVALAPSCSSRQKTDELASSSGSGTSPELAQSGAQSSSRALRLFEEAVQSFNQTKQQPAPDWSALEKKFRAVLGVDDHFAEAYYNLGVIYDRQRKVDQAKVAYKAALERKPSLKEAAENLAVIAQNEGRPGDALAIYQEVLRQRPDDGAVRARMAALYREAGDTDRAMRLAREALMREPQNLTAYKVMMRVNLDRNQLNMARLVALRAMKLDATDPELYFTMGLILLKEGDELAAIGQLKRAVREQDDFLPARLQLAEIALKHRDWSNAAEQCRKIVEYDPQNLAARIDLGLAYKGLGQIDKALAEYEAATKADPASAQPYFYMGVLFHKNKDLPEKALEHYKKFIAASSGRLPVDHPVFEAVKECEQYLRQLREAERSPPERSTEAVP